MSLREDENYNFAIVEDDAEWNREVQRLMAYSSQMVTRIIQDVAVPRLRRSLTALVNDHFVRRVEDRARQLQEHLAGARTALERLRSMREQAAQPPFEGVLQDIIEAYQEAAIGIEPPDDDAFDNIEQESNSVCLRKSHYPIFPIEPPSVR